MALHCFIYPFNNFQILIANVSTMKCGGCCENVKLQMGNYQLKTCMFAIDMSGCDIMLGDEWLCMLGTITMDLKCIHEIC